MDWGKGAVGFYPNQICWGKASGFECLLQKDRSKPCPKTYVALFPDFFGKVSVVAVTMENRLRSLFPQSKSAKCLPLHHGNPAMQGKFSSLAKRICARKNLGLHLLGGAHMMVIQPHFTQGYHPGIYGHLSGANKGLYLGSPIPAVARMHTQAGPHIPHAEPPKPRLPFVAKTNHKKVPNQTIHPTRKSAQRDGNGYQSHGPLVKVAELDPPK